jgi:hypothetical protein
MSRLLSPGVIGALRVIVSHRQASVRELDRQMTDCGVKIGLRTLHTYIYELEDPAIRVPLPPTDDPWWDRGDRAPGAKLHEDGAREALEARGEVSSRELAELRGVSPSTIRMAWTGQRYRHLEEGSL